ncbi:MAG: CAP domain-containing protein [Rhodobacteraceae bacterium]|nr:CAP domain-containing protein [Paracoccaceae bacterium]
MWRLMVVFTVGMLGLSACVATTGDGVERITGGEANAIRLNQLDLVNAVRAQVGSPPLTLSSELTAAAETHARDIASQLRAWNFGSDRSSPQTRAERAGFNGIVTSEDVAETFMGNTEIFQAWISNARAREAMQNPAATHMGLGWYQEASGKLWWVMDIGAASRAVQVATAE